MSIKLSLKHQLEDLIRDRAAAFDVKPMHWINGWDESVSFCRECAEKKITELKKKNPEDDCTLDGGWDTEIESLPSCETCGCDLDGDFLDSLCDEELTLLEENGFDLNSPGDCWTLDKILTSNPDSLSDRLTTLALKILTKNENHL
jgi:hypothetical protein